MADDWRERPLGELTDNFDGVRVPVKEADRRAGPYPYYGASGVVDHVDRYLFDGEYLLIAEDGENLRTRNTPAAFLARGRFWVNNHAHIVRGNNDADTRFLVYALSAADISGYLTGSTMPKLTQGNMNRIPILAPPLPEQRAIAHILGTLDDKIELNRRMNETLEAMARALFKSWFVDFDPVRAKAEGRDPGLPKPLADLFPDSFEDSELGEIPKGWRVATLAAVCDVIDCLHSKKPERRESGRPLLQLSNIRDDGLMDMADTYFIDDDDYGQWISRMEASAGDCVITNVGRVGAVAQVPSRLRAALGRNMTGIRCRATFPDPTFLIECLLSQSMAEEMALRIDSGTILDALNVRSIPELRFVKPSGSLLEQFEARARPLRRRMEDGLAESRTLGALRDTLLPKLISGELRVKDAERMAAKATA
jgi:type I restriction enzyme, S subunit